MSGDDNWLKIIITGALLVMPRNLKNRTVAPSSKNSERKQDMIGTREVSGYMILAGDIGGTNTRIALFEGNASSLTLQRLEIYSSRDYETLEEIVRDFLFAVSVPIDGACFGVAGPVKHGRCVTSNLKWEVDSASLAKAVKLPSTHLINDVEANAYGISALSPEDFSVLNEGEANVAGNAALIAAGTGLGEAGLIARPNGYEPFASEGGHADFAPRDDLEMDLLRYLLRKFRRVSYERVLSGPGLYNLYQFFRDTHRADEPAWLANEIRGLQDPAPLISQAAVQGQSELCVLALDLFMSLYGAEAGNLALKMMATGGLYVGGGIAPKIIKKFQEPLFWKAFTNKGRLSPLLEEAPVRIILNDKTALLGAANLAAIQSSNG